jgi:hypothetical protein
MASSSENEFESESEVISEATSPKPAKKNTKKNKRRQTLYDATAERSRKDRFVDLHGRDRRTQKPVSTKPVSPDVILSSRWQRALKRQKADIESDEEEVRLMQAGLVVPSERHEALPDSVRISGPA